MVSNLKKSRFADYSYQEFLSVYGFFPVTITKDVPSFALFYGHVGGEAVSPYCSAADDTFISTVRLIENAQCIEALRTIPDLLG